MITLVLQGEIYSPDPLGIKDILIAGEKIIALEEHGHINIQGIDVQRIDATGKKIIPGIIDAHVHLHLGHGEQRLDYLFRLAKETEIPITQIIPTHVNSKHLLEDAVQFTMMGGYIDLTANEEPPTGDYYSPSDKRGDEILPGKERPN